jgi:hypothetical protein
MPGLTSSRGRRGEPHRYRGTRLPARSPQQPTAHLPPRTVAAVLQEVDWAEVQAAEQVEAPEGEQAAEQVAEQVAELARVLALTQPVSREQP